MKKKPPKTRQNIKNKSQKLITGFKENISNLNKEQVREFINNTYSKVKDLSAKTKLAAEKAILSSEFEDFLDGLIRYRKSVPVERSEQDTREQSLQRIKSKLILVLKLYKNEVEIVLASTLLPAKFAKYFFMLLVALELFDLSEKNVKEVTFNEKTETIMEFKL